MSSQTSPSASTASASTSISGVDSHKLDSRRNQVIASWCQAIRDFYPNFLTQTYFLPPLLFRRVPYKIASGSSFSELVPQPAPVMSPQGRPVLFPDPSQPSLPQGPALPVAGCLYSLPPSAPTPIIPVVDSDIRHDACLHLLRSCLRVLADTLQEVMMVVCELDFRKYLDGETDPIHRAECALFPRPADLRAQKQDVGDFDFLILHRIYGLVTMESRLVGANPSMVPTDRVIVKKVQQAVKQLKKAKTVLHHLVCDLSPGPIRVTGCLMIPYLTSQQLSQALAAAPAVAQDLVQCVGAVDVQDAISRCLCADQVPGEATLRAGSVTPQLTGWWQVAVQGAGPDPHMSDQVYEQLLARFAGPATTVEVATPFPPRRVLRSEGEAVAETGLRMKSLALTPEQVVILGRPDPCVYLTGPPGCGKTLLLHLKARQWLNEGHHVHVVCLSNKARAVSSLIAAQLQTSGTAHAVTQHTFKIHKEMNTAICTLAALSHNGLWIIVDEVDGLTRDNFVEWCRQLRETVPDLQVWAAGVCRLHSPPAWLTVETSITAPLRCPPTVQREVERTRDIDGGDIPFYTSPAWPAPTEGPPVMWLQHANQPGHIAGYPDDCEACGRDIGQYLHHLGVDQPGHPLQWRDVFIISLYDPSPSAGMVRGLQQQGIPVGVLPGIPTQRELDQVAFGLQNQVTVTRSDNVRGLERRIVILMEGGFGVRDRLFAMSRCTSLLICVGHPEDTASHGIMKSQSSGDPEKRVEDTDNKTEAEVVGGSTYASATETIESQQKSADKEILSEEQIATSKGLEESTEYSLAETIDSSSPVEMPVSEDVLTSDESTDDDNSCFYCSESSVDPPVHTSLYPDQVVETHKCAVEDSQTQQPDEAATDPSMEYSTPIFASNWQFCRMLSSDGGDLQKPGSDIILQVPHEAVGKDNVWVSFAVCADPVQVHHKMKALKLPNYEVIVTPLAEYTAGKEFVFQHPVTIKLPHWLPPDYDPDCVHVYHINHDDDGNIVATVLDRTPEQTGDHEHQSKSDQAGTSRLEEEESYHTTSEVLAKISAAGDTDADSKKCMSFRIEEDHILISTDRFCAFVCTYCRKKKKEKQKDVPQLFVMASVSYVSQTEVNISAHIWDQRINVEDCRQEQGIKKGEIAPLNLLADLGETSFTMTLRTRELQHRLDINGQPLVPVEKTFPESICGKCLGQGKLRAKPWTWALEYNPDTSPSRSPEAVVHIIHQANGNSSCELTCLLLRVSSMNSVDRQAVQQNPQARGLSSCKDEFSRRSSHTFPKQLFQHACATDSSRLRDCEAAGPHAVGISQRDNTDLERMQDTNPRRMRDLDNISVVTELLYGGPETFEQRMGACHLDRELQSNPSSEIQVSSNERQPQNAGSGRAYATEVPDINAAPQQPLDALCQPSPSENNSRVEQQTGNLPSRSPVNVDPYDEVRQLQRQLEEERQARRQIEEELRWREERRATNEARFRSDINRLQSLRRQQDHTIDIPRALREQQDQASLSQLDIQIRSAESDSDDGNVPTAGSPAALSPTSSGPGSQLQGVSGSSLDSATRMENLK